MVVKFVVLVMMMLFFIDVGIGLLLCVVDKFEFVLFGQFIKGVVVVFMVMVLVVVMFSQVWDMFIYSQLLQWVKSGLVGDDMLLKLKNMW